MAVEIVLIGLVGAWLGLLVGGRLTTSIGPLETRLSIEVAPTGGSVLSLPPSASSASRPTTGRSGCTPT